MRTFRLRPLGGCSGAALLVYWCGIGSPVQAQDAAKAPHAPLLTVGQAAASPGSNVMIPVYFKPDQKVALRKLVVAVDYVSNNLEFQEISSAGAEQPGLQVSAAVTKGAPDSKGVTRSKLLLTLAADGKAAPALPEGIVGFLMFRLSEQAKPFVITIKPDVISFEAARQPVQEGLKINVQPGSITVENQDELPGMTCFFFSH